MPTKTVEVDGEKWQLSNDPLMSTVRYVQEMQIQMLQDNLTDEQMANLADENEGDEISDEELMKTMIDEKGIKGLSDFMWDQAILSPLQTISLAANREMEIREVDDLTAQEFINLKEASEEVLGGDAVDFFERLGIDTSSMLNNE